MWSDFAWFKINACKNKHLYYPNVLKILPSFLFSFFSLSLSFLSFPFSLSFPFPFSFLFLYYELCKELLSLITVKQWTYVPWNTGTFASEPYACYIVTIGKPTTLLDLPNLLLFRFQVWSRICSYTDFIQCICPGNTLHSALRWVNL